MIVVAIQIAVVVLLTILSGLLAVSETALVSSRKARLKRRAEDGDKGATTALTLAEEPTRFLSMVQIGISLIGVLAGAFGGGVSDAEHPQAVGDLVYPALANGFESMPKGIVQDLRFRRLLLGAVGGEQKTG